MSHFRIYDDCIELVRECRPLWEQIGQTDPDHKRQLRRSAKAVPSNVSEGMHRWDGNRGRAFKIAMGEAHETKTHIEVAIASGDLDENEQTARAMDRADKIAATLYRCLHGR